MDRLKRDALESQTLLRESAAKKYDLELAKDGLVILKACYGRLDLMDASTEIITEASPDPDFLNYEVVEASNGILDVTVPLQNLVTDSQLKLPPYTKSHFIGFYDPHLGEPKHLRLVYRYGPEKKLHQVTLADSAPLRIPLRSHLLV